MNRKLGESCHVQIYASSCVFFPFWRGRPHLRGSVDEGSGTGLRSHRICNCDGARRLYGRPGSRHPRPAVLYGWLELLIAATGALSLLGVSAVRILYVAAYHTVSGSMPVLETLRFTAAILVLFLPTFLMGGTLPILALGTTRTSSETSARLSRLYWVNTAGAVVGALCPSLSGRPFRPHRRLPKCRTGLRRPTQSRSVQRLCAHRPWEIVRK
jgi:hypothetical protein